MFEEDYIYIHIHIHSKLMGFNLQKLSTIYKINSNFNLQDTTYKLEIQHFIESRYTKRLSADKIYFQKIH